MRVSGIERVGLIKINNARVYDLEESMMAASYPKAVRPIDMDNTRCLSLYDAEGYLDITADPNFMRITKYLGKAKPGSGHDCFLKGVVVNFDLCLPEYIWRQLDRYHHIDFVSSQSKMHKILEIDINTMCNKYVSSDSIKQLNEYINMYNNFDSIYEQIDYLILRNGEQIEFTKENIFNIIIANTPSGIMLTARMTTNYLQLKSILGQREFHKMDEWKVFCEWALTLPLFKEFIGRI